MDVKIKSLKTILEKGKRTLTDAKKPKYFFEEKRLGELEDKKSNSECLKKLKLKVIYFDETERRVQIDETIKELRKSRKEINTKSSCDAIKFVVEKKTAEILFIETKSIINFDKDKTIKSWDDRMKKIEGFKFYKKVADSLSTMSDIVEHKNMNLSEIEKQHYYDTPKYPILLVDIDKETEIEESFKFTLDFLALENELYKVEKDKPQKLEDAKLSYCGNFDERYNN